MTTVRVLWLLAALSGCAPVVQPEVGQVVHLTFSAAAWGGLPFTTEAKQQAMVQALLGRRVERLEQAVAWILETQPASVTISVQHYTAFFEVDARGLPLVTSGYQLKLHLPATAQTVRANLTNGATGVTRSIRLDPARLVAERSEHAP